MERSAFELMRQAENTWWNRGRSLVATNIFRRFSKPSGDVLDYGAGNGGMAKTLSSVGVLVYAFEPDEEARNIAHPRGYAGVYANESEALARSYGVVAFFDVLEHLEDDKGALQRVSATLNPGGHVIINVPAFQWLWGTHDVTHHHYRRYNRRQVRQLLESAGFDTVFVSHWVFFLFPAAMLVRFSGRTGESAVHVAPWIDQLFFFLIEIETVLMRFFSLPFGTSVIALGKKR